MRDETLIEPFAANEYFVDGFGEFHVADGVLRCAGYRVQPPSRTNGDPLKIVVVRLVVPICGANEAAEATREVLLREPVKGFHMIRPGKTYS